MLGLEYHEESPECMVAGFGLMKNIPRHGLWQTQNGPHSQGYWISKKWVNGYEKRGGSRNVR